MVRSMTGYGKSEFVAEGREINVEIRSVNNRYLDVNVKTPRYLMFAEDKIRKLIAEYITRAKIDIFVNISNSENSGKSIKIDKDLLLSYINSFKDICNETGLTYDLSASRFVNSDVVSSAFEEEDEDELWKQISSVIKDALEKYNVMREEEGERLKENIYEKLSFLKQNLSLIENIVPQNIEGYKQKLYEKVENILEDKEYEESRILAEIAIYVDKTAVDEEIVRLKSHFAAMEKLLKSDGAIGKKLDFIIQEMNRETNTIGSKANELKITELVIEMKNDIEKIREQIQNIE